MTTIITKNGSGAPTAGQLSEGELAVDLTNKELYTKSGSTVIKIGSQGGSSGTFTDLTATSSFTSPGIDDNANATAITIDASENVGIGTDSPDQTLHVHKGSAGAVGSQANSVLTLENSGSAILQFLTPNTADQQIRFGDPQDNGAGYLNYSHAVGSMTFGVNGPERMRIDASGNVGIGTSNPSTSLDIVRAGVQPLRIESTTSDSVQMLLKNTAGNALIKGVGSNIVLPSGNLGIGTDAPNRALTVKSASGVPAELVSDAASSLLAFFDAGTGVRPSVGSSGSDLILNATSERMRITNTGKVLVNNTAYGSLGQLAVKQDADNAGIAIVDSTASNTFTIENNAASCKFHINTSKDFVFATTSSDTERVRINASGNLLVGTSDGSFVNGGGIKIANTQAARLKLCDSDSAGTGSADGFELTQAGTAAYIYQNENDFMAFGTNATERMRIDSSGNLQLGITSGSNRRLYLRASANNSTNYACQMENSGAQNLFFVRSDGAFNTGEGTSSPYNNTTAAAANLNVSSNGFLGRSTSSIRYKENVRDYTGSIDALRPVMFNSINEDDDKDYAGFIAEEVHETGLVEFVQYDDQGRPDAVNYANMVALLVKEIQDLKAEVAALKGA